MRISGGYATYGEAVGILVLNTKFPRIPGDVGNATTFDFPVRYKVVEEANASNIVAEADRARALLPAFIEAAQSLEREGVKALTTTCGFLTVVQDEIAAAVSVPVITSSLFLVPLIRRMFASGRTIGVVTAHAGALSSRHLAAAGISPDWAIAVRGMESSPAFTQAIVRPAADSSHDLDVEAVTAEVVEVCDALAEAHPDLGAIVFECTNLQPYAVAVQDRLQLPVFGIYHVVNLLHSGAVNPPMAGHM